MRKRMVAVAQTRDAGRGSARQDTRKRWTSNASGSALDVGHALL
jgi:hypothetical protein